MTNTNRSVKFLPKIPATAIAIVGFISSANVCYAQTLEDYSQCLHPKPPAPGTLTSDEIFLQNSENLLTSTVAGDPLNIPANAFNHVAFKTGDKETDAKAATPSKTTGSMNLTTGNANSRVSISGQRASSLGNGAARFMTLELSAPTAKSGDTQITRLDEFASDAQVKLSYLRTTKTWAVKSLGKKEENKIRGKVLENLKAKAASAAGCDKQCKAKVAALDINGISLTSDCVKTFATKGDFDDFDGQYNSSASIIFGGSASIGYKEFEFKDLRTDKDVSKDKTPWSLELFAGRYSKDRKSLLRAGYSYVEDYKASDKVTLCQAAEEDAMGVQICENLTTSGPKDDQKDVGFLEFRQQFDNLFVRAATVKVSYDFDDKESEIDMPIYLLTDSESNLNGGIRLGWSDSEDVKFGVFVGSSFSLGL